MTTFMLHTANAISALRVSVTAIISFERNERADMDYCVDMEGSRDNKNDYRLELPQKPNNPIKQIPLFVNTL